ncbi:hypothetical protein CDAR_426951 [Caerostris darwini]|uniref:Uncharacterized protein n=1 Tax=Caerostris darwini TaxID=1538125 RepID=A0AAV4R9F0_9ARAC|nr:hypothetical protein CDAR_426951 [Caerostris darwini]
MATWNVTTMLNPDKMQEERNPNNPLEITCPGTERRSAGFTSALARVSPSLAGSAVCSLRIRGFPLGCSRALHFNIFDTFFQLRNCSLLPREIVSLFSSK